uniref:Uncharacterized protein n=1 Tax=Pleurotus pulmonarius TaxID=28995 RepID=A0A2U8LK72_PLEPU|nr:hypothetical protein MN721_mgp08 [Pleurotus pulmonarius]AWL21266.1 hypothetical protein [Pleurotus pulmonarius]QBS47737.1 hypothetical protein [Pleurotus pulmonarius]UKQ56002.1 hypothetical protein [Pleurotus pulmonarius]
MGNTIIECLEEFSNYYNKNEDINKNFILLLIFNNGFKNINYVSNISKDCISKRFDSLSNRGLNREININNLDKYSNKLNIYKSFFFYTLAFLYLKFCLK